LDVERAFEVLTQNQAGLSAKIGDVSDRLVNITDNALITTVERLINRRNGESGNA